MQACSLLFNLLLLIPIDLNNVNKVSQLTHYIIYELSILNVTKKGSEFAHVEINFTTQNIQQNQ